MRVRIAVFVTDKKKKKVRNYCKKQRKILCDDKWVKSIGKSNSNK